MDFWNLMRCAAKLRKHQERDLSAEFDVLKIKVETYIKSAQAEIAALKAQITALQSAPPTPIVDPAPEVVTALSVQVDNAIAALDSTLYIGSPF